MPVYSPSPLYGNTIKRLTGQAGNYLANTFGRGDPDNENRMRMLANHLSGVLPLETNPQDLAMPLNIKTPRRFYRGSTESSPHGIGLGWTTDYEYAKQSAIVHAKKSGRKPVVYEAELDIKNPYISDEYLYSSKNEIPPHFDAAMTPNMHEVYVYDPKQIKVIKKEFIK